MVKQIKKTVAIIMAVCLAAMMLTATSFAADTQTQTGYAAIEAGRYPFIFIHGMLGWGEGSPKEGTNPYWGNTEEDNVMTYLRSEGYEVYNPSVGPASSAWDRACELYAQLTGTVVDYGEAHSKEYGHARYGRDFTGKATMGTAWDMTTPLNLVGHSFGGVTVRLFASLVAYGDETERAASGDACSPLFKGGHDNAIYSVNTLSAPHNGSTPANYMNASSLIPAAIVTLLNKNAVSDDPTYDLMAEQWGLTDSFNLRGCFKFAFSKDHVAYDLTIGGAKKINEKIKTVENAYYFSYSSVVTESDALGYAHIKNSDTLFSLFKLSAPMISYTVNVFVDGVYLDKSWSNNDGIVPLVSALHPENEPYDDYSADKQLKTGVWYVMPTLEGVDHYDFCTAAQTGELGTREEYFGFYTDLIERVYGL